jgi:hypothetical protein
MVLKRHQKGEKRTFTKESLDHRLNSDLSFQSELNKKLLLLNRIQEQKIFLAKNKQSKPRKYLSKSVHLRRGKKAAKYNARHHQRSSQLDESSSNFLSMSSVDQSLPQKRRRFMSSDFKTSESGANDERSLNMGSPASPVSGI